jgi:hypothetical protein
VLIGDHERRWDIDARGHGVADGGWIVSAVQRLVALLGQPDWVAEDPDLHLGPHLRAVCEDKASPWTLLGWQAMEADGVFTVDLAWERPNPKIGRMRADVFALIGAFAETVTFISQQIGDGSIEFHVTTGMGGEDSPFAPHGHLVCLRISGDAVSAMTTARQAD